MIYKQLLLRLLEKHASYRLPFSSSLAKISSYYYNCYENVCHDPEKNGEYWLLDIIAQYEADIVDVGSFVGDYSLRYLSRTESGHVISVEPSIESYSILCSTLKHHLHNKESKPPRLHVFNCAASSSDANQKFFYSSSHPNGSTLTLEFAHMPSFVSKNEYSERVVKTKTLDSIILEAGLRIESVALLKIDAEGHENEVLSGASNLLKTVGIVQIEYGQHNLAKRWLLQDIYLEYGRSFHIGRLYPRSLLISDNFNMEWEDFKGRNLILINKSTDAHLVAKKVLEMREIQWS